MRVLLLTLFTFWFKVLLVSGVYIEEAFQTDWQLENLGHYDCVIESAEQNALIVFSSLDSKTLVSLVNETDGKLIYRHLWNSKASGAMAASGGAHFLLKDAEGEVFAFDTASGLQNTSFDLSSVGFTSQCKPDLIDVKVSSHGLQVLDSESQLEVLNTSSTSTIDEIVFFWTDYSSLLKVLFSTADGKYIFQSLANDDLVTEWTREEIEGKISAHAFVDLQDDSLQTVSEEVAAEKAFQNAWEAYIFRVKRNFQRLKETFRESGYSVGMVLTKLLKIDSNLSVADRDVVFGIAKLLVIASDQAVVQALDVRDGRKIWRFKSSLVDVISMEYSSKANELLVFSKDGRYEIYDLSDVFNPQLKTQTSLDGSAINSVLPLNEEHFLVKLESGQEQVVAKEGQPSHLESTFITDHDKDGVYGHIVDEGGFLTETWKIILPKSEELVAFASKPDEPIASLGQTLGNRSVLYKYLYPNLAAYATLNAQDQKLYVNLIDTVTGELLYSQYHEDNVESEQPINIVIGEYWLVYSYFSAEPLPEQKLVVVELYESLEANKRISKPEKRSEVLKRSHKPKAVSKAYLFPEVIKSLIVSRTKFGITSKALILELESGQITYVNKEILSARRVEESKMTDDAKREFMAIPYISTIPLNDQFIITHSRSLLMGEYSELVSVPTNLESTAIVCDIGHDIFCSRIYPSGQFDIMSPDFEKGKLMATIIGLLVLCYFLRPSVESSKLKKLWLVR